jgi:hypothetical protein
MILNFTISIADISNVFSLPRFFNKETSLILIDLETNIQEPPCLSFYKNYLQVYIDQCLDARFDHLKASVPKNIKYLAF